MCSCRSMCIGLLVCLSALLALAPQPVRAANDETAQGEADEWAEEGRNALGLFLGVTTADGDSDFSAGLDYERRLSRRFGIGGVIEFTRNDFRERIVALSAYWHVWKELKLLAAPGVEIERSDGSDAFLFRIGAEYGFAIGKGFEIAPALNFDFTDETTAVVYGLGFAKKF